MSTRNGQYSPWNFECAYKDHCPHLEGSSTAWVWDEYCRSYEENQEHWRIRDIQDKEISEALNNIGRLEKENALLKAKLHALHQKQFKTNKHSKKSSDSDASLNQDKPDSTPKKRGAPYGHPGWTRRKPDHVDKTVKIPAPKICPHCGCSRLNPINETKNHFQEDIVLVSKTHVTLFQHNQAFCPKCGQDVIQAAEGELLNCPIGPVTKAAAVFLRYGLRIPYRKVHELFKVFFNMPFVPASAVAFDRKATKLEEPLHDDLKEKIRAAIVAYGDETHWRENGINHFVWYAGNPDLAFFHIDRHRSTEAAQSIFGENFEGTLVTDAYAAYNGVHAKSRQSCLGHILATTKEIKNEILLEKSKFQDPLSIRFCDQITAFFKEAVSLETASHQEIKKLYSTLDSICKKVLSFDKAENLRKRLLPESPEYNRLFTFLLFPDVEPTNNHSEQSIRNLVIFRKICFGTRSKEGSHSHSVLPSLLLTAVRQGKHPLDFFKTLFTSDTKTAQAALYKNSS